MKNILFFILLVSNACLIVSCGNKNKDNEAEQTIDDRRYALQSLSRHPDDFHETAAALCIFHKIYC